jgi:protein-disulfide isomerase
MSRNNLTTATALRLSTIIVAFLGMVSEAYALPAVATPGKVFKVCGSNGLCLEDPRATRDECTGDDQCRHWACDPNGYCSQVFEPGEDKCTQNRECGHKECDPNGYCLQVSGRGRDKCTGHYNCSHQACNFLRECVRKLGPGPRWGLCQNDGNCKEKLRPNECNLDGKCVEAAEGVFGVDKCWNDEMCVPQYARDIGTSPGTDPVISVRAGQSSEVPTLPKESFDVDGDREILRSAPAAQISFGPKDSRDVIVMFQDLTCGMCARALKKYVPRFLELAERENRIRFEIRDMSLSDSADELTSAAGVRCALESGKYIDALELSYDLHGRLDEDAFTKIAAAIGRPREEFLKCVEHTTHLHEVKKDRELAERLNIKGTPAFFVNGVRIMGTIHELEAFERLLSLPVMPQREMKTEEPDLSW